MPLDTFRLLVAAELTQTDTIIKEALTSKVPLAIEIAQHIVQSGGKRIRPITLLLTAKACGMDEQHHYFTLAAIIELIHTATLLHDDVVDQSTKRRGQSTANLVWGNAAPVLVGDFLYSRAFEMMVSLDSPYILKILARGTNTIAEGEVLQLAKRHDPNVTEEDYLCIIHAKTAKLFEIATHLGAVSCQVPEKTEQSLKDYGMHIGMAYQLVDDILDYQAPCEIMGKNVGDDLAEGKTTLPLIYALQNANPNQKQILQKSIREGSLKELDTVKEAILDTGAIEYSMTLAKNHVSLAKESLQVLQENPYRKALQDLADFTINRIS